MQNMADQLAGSGTKVMTVKGENGDPGDNFSRKGTRTEGFADGVFSIAFTLLVLDFHPPASLDHLDAFLLGLWPRLLAYSISCLLIGLIWANYRAMLLHFGDANRLTIFLSMLLFADVAFLPFPTALLAEAISTDSGLSEAAFLYGLVLTVGGIFFNALWLYELGRPRAGNDLPHVRRHFTLISVRFALGPVSYLAATLISLKYPVLAIVLYVALIAYYWFPGRSETVFSGRD